MKLLKILVPAVGWKTFQNPNYLTKIAQIGLKMIPRRKSWRSLMSSDNFFSKLGCRGPQFLLIGQKWYFGMWRAGIKNLPKSILMLQKGSNMALNDLKKIVLTIHDVLRHFFHNWDVGALNFRLSVKNGIPEDDKGV